MAHYTLYTVVDTDAFSFLLFKINYEFKSWFFTATVLGLPEKADQFELFECSFCHS